LYTGQSLTRYLLFFSEMTCSISLAYKQFSQAEKEAIVGEGFQATGSQGLLNPIEN